MRLDIFLPFLRLIKPGRKPPRRSGLYLFARTVLPHQLFSDFSSEKNRGLIRKTIRWLGPGWEASPIRRIIQTASFVLFLILFFYVCWPYSAAPDPAAQGWPAHYTYDFAVKERINAEIFLVLDPLVSFSTAIAGQTWVWSLIWAGVILAIGVFFPRGFCGYLCPLGTLIDLFDWSIGKRVDRFKIQRRGWWINLKYYLLLATLITAFFGIMLAGTVAAIPIITRGFLFILGPLQQGLMQGWYQVPAMNTGHVVSIMLFVVVLGLGFLRPRFWCRYVCPTGAVFSLSNLVFRASERKVEESCIDCDLCVKVCPFDAIKTDYSTRTMECTLCQTCAGACPTNAIKFVGRWDNDRLKPKNQTIHEEVSVSRRGFLVSVIGGVSTALATQLGFSAPFEKTRPMVLPVRPPMSVPEDKFLELCISCGECYKVCPNNVLQSMGFDQGIENLWTPEVVADWAGCEPSCNNCGQVCPTGAIRALPLIEKKVARMGLAEVEHSTCLPWVDEEACQLCVDECNAAGYNAIEFERVHPKLDGSGFSIEGTGFAAPKLIDDLCVGCGLCQSACYRINVSAKKVLKESAIVIYAGPGKEDRIMNGLYTDLRRQESDARQLKRKQQQNDFGDFYSS